MGQETKALIAGANEKLKHTNIILEDMMKNKKEYSSRDLSWRNLDLLKAMVLTVSELSLVLEDILDKNMSAYLEDEEDESEEDEEETLDDFLNDKNNEENEYEDEEDELDEDEILEDEETENEEENEEEIEEEEEEEEIEEDEFETEEGSEDE